MLCGANPIPASSGKLTHHRLNHGGDRQANQALRLIAPCRLQYCQRTREYVKRRTAEVELEQARGIAVEEPTDPLRLFRENVGRGPDRLDKDVRGRGGKSRLPRAFAPA